MNPGRAFAAFLLATFVAAPAAAQQEAKVYVGGTLTALTQTHGEGEPGGTGRSGSFFIGGWVSPRVAVEFEPSFGPTFSREYRYQIASSITAHVVASRHDSFWSGQLRLRAGGVEPVFGLGYKHGNLERHGTTSAGTTYFNDSEKEHGLAAVFGLDAPIQVAPHLQVLPTVRMLLNLGPSNDAFSGVASDTNTGTVVLRYGGGARITF